MKHNSVMVIGAGLAGCEAAWQLANRGIHVDLFEMKPQKRSPAHHSDDFAELVCSNSLRADRLQNAVGLLKQEMRECNSIIMRAADATRVPAGGALAVDRIGFSRYVTQTIQNCDNIEIRNEEITEIPEMVKHGDKLCIVATGPLTSDKLSKDIQALFGDGLYFFDAAAPIVTLESLDMNKVFRASRYGKGEGNDYLNCPMNKEEYAAFHAELVEADTVELKDFEDKKIFEGCMPVEVMAKRGEMTLAFGPLKPVGLTDPRTGRRPFAVVQLRQDNAQGTLFNMVGFQTHLKFPEQKRVFRMIPGMENAEFVRYGVMHRNTFLHSPGKLNESFQCIDRSNLYFAGQMTGVEGYVESAASGLVAGISLSCEIQQKPVPQLTSQTALGALGNYIAHYSGAHFQPMNISLGLIDSYPEKIRNKQDRYDRIAERSLQHIKKLKDNGIL